MRPVLSRNWIRLLGISTLFGVMYIIVIGVFGRVDISPLLPTRLAASIQEAWPKMPFFEVAQTPTGTGSDTVTYYTVPTRQLTPQEIMRMGMTNTPAQAR